MEIPELYFPRDNDWYEWLLQNHKKHDAVYLIFYRLETKVATMRWEEAVKVAICFGWIDSTVKSLGNGKRKQYFSPRNPKSNWSALNKKYVAELEQQGLIQEAGYKTIHHAKKIGTWTAMDDIEKGIIPDDLQEAFDKNPRAFENFNSFAPSYRKGYLSWIHQAKRSETRKKRITETITCCVKNLKSRN